MHEHVNDRPPLLLPLQDKGQEYGFPTGRVFMLPASIGDPLLSQLVREQDTPEKYRANARHIGEALGSALTPLLRSEGKAPLLAFPRGGLAVAVGMQDALHTPTYIANSGARRSTNIPTIPRGFLSSSAHEVILADTFLASGGTLKQAVDEIEASSLNPGSIFIVSAIATPEGIGNLLAHPNTHILTAHIETATEWVQKGDKNVLYVNGRYLLGDAGDQSGTDQEIDALMQELYTRSH